MRLSAEVMEKLYEKDLKQNKEKETLALNVLNHKQKF